MYSFLFDRKSLILLVAGLATVGCLLFVAGLLTGVFWGVPSQEVTISATPSSPAAPALFPASQPCPPAAEARSANEEPADEPQVEPEPDFEEPVPLLEVKTRDELRYEPPPAERRAELSPPPEPLPVEEESRSVAPPEAAASPRAEATPAVLSSSSGSEPAGPKTVVYSLQVGAFRQPENSTRIVRDLQSRGYDAYVVEEGGGRAIQTVRIGRYSARDEALRAALDFRRRERKEVIVRPLGLGSVRLTSW